VPSNTIHNCARLSPAQAYDIGNTIIPRVVFVSRAKMPRRYCTIIQSQPNLGRLSETLIGTSVQVS